VSGSHHHHHHSHHFDSNKKLYIAVIVNLLLTVAQVIGGVLSGSLSLIADALHNLSDAGALAIAAVAARIAKIPANDRMTYGYRRAEILGALINSTTLAVIGVYLLYEAVIRYFDQQPIQGGIVVYVASFALLVDLVTVLLTISGAKESINIRAAFIHNISDAAASIVVIISGLLIINFQIYIVDLIATVLISCYVLVHAFSMLKECVLILMQSSPSDVDVSEVVSALRDVPEVKEAHHVHVWQLDDKRTLFEGHIVIDKGDLSRIEEIKASVREILASRFSVDHATLELETTDRCPLIK
jgi:cobalt-zinc-cadmium efflux system protein